MDETLKTTTTFWHACKGKRGCFPKPCDFFFKAKRHLLDGVVMPQAEAFGDIFPSCFKKVFDTLPDWFQSSPAIFAPLLINANALLSCEHKP